MKAKFRMYRAGSASAVRRFHGEVPFTERLKQKARAKRMTDSPDVQTEMLARMWMVCDPNRGGADADELEPMTLCSGSIGSSDGPTEEHPNPLGGKPRWHWFLPRAEATKKYLAEQGYELRKK